MNMVVQDSPRLHGGHAALHCVSAIPIHTMPSKQGSTAAVVATPTCVAVTLETARASAQHLLLSPCPSQFST